MRYEQATLDLQLALNSGENMLTRFCRSIVIARMGQLTGQRGEAYEEPKRDDRDGRVEVKSAVAAFAAPDDAVRPPSFPCRVDPHLARAATCGRIATASNAQMQMQQIVVAVASYHARVLLAVCNLRRISTPMEYDT